MNEVKEYYKSGKLRSIKIYDNNKLISKKRYRESGNFIDEWKRDEDVNCVIKDESN